jgi:RNase H-like domain found in reverse transcriptase
LRLPDFKREFILTTDWSQIAIRNDVLNHIDPETGFDHPVAFASRLLNDAERNYSPTKGELLALMWAVDKFRLYFDGRKFTGYTDHHALEWVALARYSNSNLESWAIRLQE